jgi:hypothetical protein
LPGARRTGSGIETPERLAQEPGGVGGEAVMFIEVTGTQQRIDA